MQQPVATEEVDLVDRWRQQNQGEKPRPVGRVVNPIRVAVGKAPERDDLDQCPDRNRDQEGAQGVVDVLILEPEHVGWLIGGEFVVVLEPRALLALDVIEEFNRAEHRQDPGKVGCKQQQPPVPRHGFHCVPVGQHEIPVSDCNQQKDGIVRPDVTDQPTAQFAEFTPPERRDLQRLVRTPIAALVARAKFEVVHFVPCPTRPRFFCA